MEKPVEDLSNQETGARNKRSRKNALEEFYLQMHEIYLHIMSMVKPKIKYY